MIVAGTELPANAISFGVFQLARRPDIACRLREEVRQITTSIDEIPTSSTLERLPFLTAVVNETLRLGNLVPGRLPRKVAADGMEIGGVHVTAGTVISASSNMVHMNVSIFPEPEQFQPERWLTCNVRRLERYLLAFSAGSRDCVGRYLAIREMKMFFAVLVLYFDVEVVNKKENTDPTWTDHIVAAYDRDVTVVLHKRLVD